MKIAPRSACILGLGLLLLVLSACGTGTPGMTNTFGTFSTMVNASPEKVTAAAKKTLEQMKFAGITCVGTTIDGRLTAKTASDDTVKVIITQAGENVSQVEIRVGAGDEAISTQILESIKKNL